MTSKKQAGFQGIEEGMEERTAWVSLGASGGEEGVFYTLSSSTACSQSVSLAAQLLLHRSHYITLQAGRRA